MVSFENNLFANRDYKIPNDKKTQLYDFYALTMVKPLVLSSPSASMFFKEAIESIVNHIGNEFLTSVYKCIVCEIWHVFVETAEIWGFCKDGYFANKIKPNNYSTLCDADRHVVEIFTLDELKILYKMYRLYRKLHVPKYNTRWKHFRKFQMSNKDFIKFTKKIFGELEWDSNFGGLVWLSIVDGFERLVNAMGGNNINDKIIAIDHIYDLEHHNDRVFTKDDIFADKNKSYKWLNICLCHKARVETPYVLLNYVSIGLIAPLIYAYKEIYGMTFEEFTKSSYCIKHETYRLLNVLECEKNKNTIRKKFRHFMVSHINNMGDQDWKWIVKQFMSQRSNKKLRDFANNELFMNSWCDIVYAYVKSSNRKYFL